MSIVNDFSKRHIGINDADTSSMVKTIQVASLEALIQQTIPADILTQQALAVESPISEQEYLTHIKGIAEKNEVYKSYIGLGYYGTHTPGVILRNIFENPGWYTQYTPYQAEISQGRLEALLNFQTVITELTALPIANASLLDEATAAAEAMSMLYHNRENTQATKIFVSKNCFPQTQAVLRTRALPLGIEIVEGDELNVVLDDTFFAILVQYPDTKGEIHDYKKMVDEMAALKIKTIVAADILSLCVLAAPGSWGADVVVGSTQRLGVPMGFGGPHAAYFACKDDYKRVLPGRIIGVSVDRLGNRALRMALQTREQHIRREKATSNICTAQGLLAIMASMYAIYHGPEGLQEIAMTTHNRTMSIAEGLKSLGYEVVTKKYFDTIKVAVSDKETLRKALESARINLRYYDTNHIGITCDETTTEDDCNNLIAVFENLSNKKAAKNLSENVFEKRKVDFLKQEVFHAHHSETQMLRYIKKLENRDLSLGYGMIPLGSCTMKLNATTEMMPLSWEKFSSIHPFAPATQVEGYLHMIKTLEQYLCAVTSFQACSLQPNSGAQGEYAGLLCMRAYHHDRNEQNRNIILIPSSAHGTNPASAVMAGFKVIVTKCNDGGEVDVADLKEKAEMYKDDLAGLMITYPSTHGVFENTIKEICKIIHDNKGLVYMDGANMNAQVGYTSPAMIGADVCHLNLHKTFAIPHGGGGPGVGPICVNEKLAPYLPTHPLVKCGGEKGIEAVSAAPYGSASILLISYAYIKMLGAEGLKKATSYAILNANYIKARLEKYYEVLYTGENNTVAHELILDFRAYKKSCNIEVEDVAKRLMDYGFHAPTVSFPVAGTLMIEPTESEDKHEIDRFCDALISIKNEIINVENGTFDKLDNPLKNAPHTAQEVTADTWSHAYSRELAAYPVATLRDSKFWCHVAKVNSAQGDRNLICTCEPIESYQES